MRPHGARLRHNVSRRGVIAMSTDSTQTPNPARGSLRLAGSADEEEDRRPKLPRQFVNFTFYRARPEWRLLDAETKERAIREFTQTVDDFRRELLIHTYSLAGLRTNAEFMIWRIGYSLDVFQEMTARLNQTELGKYTEVSQSFLSMTK